MKLKLLILSLSFINFVYSNNGDKFMYGLNAGVKFAHKDNAFRYTGYYNNQLENYFNIPDVYWNIRSNILNNKDFTFFEYSEIFRYQPSPIYGFFFGYNTSPNLSFDADFNFSNLIVNTGYTLNIIDPGNFTSQDIYKTGYIRGKESRFNGRINMNFYSKPNKIKYVFGLSGIFNAWRIEENLVELDGILITDLHQRFNPNNNFSIKTQGNEFTYGINLGINHEYSEKMTIQLMYQPYINRSDYFLTKQQIINLGNSYIKPKAKLEHDITVRFII